MKSQLAVVVHDDDGAPCHLAARTTRGGNGDDGCHAVCDTGRAAFNGGVVGERPFVRGGNGDPLGAVNRRAATNCNQTIALVGCIHRHRCAHGRLSRVGRGLVKHGHRQAGQGVQCLLQNSGRFDACVRHDQRPGNANPRTFLLKQVDRTKIELDLGDVVDHGHGGLR